MMNELSRKNDKMVEVAKTEQIPSGKIKHIEVNGIEMIVANIDDKYYAVNDRCGHSSARLSMGTIKGAIVTCPLHAAQFDVTTGKKIREPNLIPVGASIDNLPEDWKKYAQHAYEIASYIKTYDQEKYETRVESGRLLIKLPTPLE